MQSSLERLDNRDVRVLDQSLHGNRAAVQQEYHLTAAMRLGHRQPAKEVAWMQLTVGLPSAITCDASCFCTGGRSIDDRSWLSRSRYASAPHQSFPRQQDTQSTTADEAFFFSRV